MRQNREERRKEEGKEEREERRKEEGKERKEGGGVAQKKNALLGFVIKKLDQETAT